jgi:hypothetical protein
MNIYAPSFNNPRTVTDFAIARRPRRFRIIDEWHKNGHSRAEMKRAITKRKPKNYYAMPVIPNLFFLRTEVL